MSDPRSELAPRREGVAVATAVLLLLALTALAHGALLLARQELAASRAGGRLLGARAAAMAGAALAGGAPLPDGADGAPLWGSIPLVEGSWGRVTYKSTATRLSRELWLLVGSGHVEGGAVSRIARIAWVFDPVARAGDRAAVLLVGEGAPSELRGEVDGWALTRPEPPLTRAACEPWSASLDSLFSVGATAAVAIDPRAGAMPRIGALGPDTLLALLPVREAGVGTPGPLEEGGVCLPDAPWSWGDPDRPASACGGHVAVRAVEGDLTVAGGVGQALLVVRGDLTLGEGARLYGFVAVGGALRITGAARLTGLAEARGGVTVDEGATVRGSACWAVRALDAGRELLSAPVALPASGWIGPL